MKLTLRRELARFNKRLIDRPVTAPQFPRSIARSFPYHATSENSRRSNRTVLPLTASLLLELTE